MVGIYVGCKSQSGVNRVYPLIQPVESDTPLRLPVCPATSTEIQSLVSPLVSCYTKEHNSVSTE